LSDPSPILLFDMDGVLLQPRAYHRALRENVAYWGRQLGYQNVELSQMDVHAFESAGITAEWISSSLCVALMLEKVWRLEPLADIPADHLRSPLPSHDLAGPDFNAATQWLGCMNGSLTQEERCVTYLREQPIDHAVSDQLIRLVQGARFFKQSAVHRLQQELVIGSGRIRAVYGLDPWWDHPGYLESIDLPCLDQADIQTLLEKKSCGQFHMAILTNRPSTPPDGFFDTPEAEIGLTLIGLDSSPAVGAGLMGWLADRHGLNTNAYLKPSPVHALTALRVALGDPLDKAADQALTVLGNPRGVSAWESLHGRSVFVFEDASHGLLSLQQAAEQLSRLGIEMDLHLIGIAENQSKIETLASHGASVYAHIEPALRDLGFL
jgi:hypothetical protein